MEICEFFIVYISCTSMGAKTLPIVGEKKEIKDFCMCFWKELERKRERIYLENLQFFFSSSRGLGGIYGKNLTLQLLVAP